jgi:signal transduction histidine kinase
MRKVLAAHWRRMHSAREVQKCIEAIRATAPDTVEHQQAFLAYGMALQRELEKSGFSVSPPGAAQNIAALLQKFETGTATTSETGTPLALELSENDLGDCLVEQFKRGGWFEAFQRKGVRFEANIDPSIPTVRFDYYKVRQIVANLLDNVLAHTPSGGSVTLNCMPRPNGVEVSLTGALEHDQKILDDCEAVSLSPPQTYEESLPIGLTVAKRLVLAHHGKIWVEASPTGSRYAFLLPMDQG